MNICVIIPTFQRLGITVLSAKRILNQTLSPKRVLIVGSCSEDEKIKDLIDVDYLNSPNDPLGKKVQNGINYCYKKYNPDAIMCCGSDDLLSLNWIKNFSEYINQYEVVTSMGIYTISPDPIKILFTTRRGAMGIGRLVSRRILERMKYELYSNVNSRLDATSQNRLKEFKASFYSYNKNDVKCLSVKGPWKTITSFKGVQNAYCSSEIIENPIIWLENNFPEILSFFGKK